MSHITLKIKYNNAAVMTYNTKNVFTLLNVVKFHCCPLPEQGNYTYGI